jgi:hypothetical protein
MLEDNWTPEAGFKGEEAVPSTYSPLIVSKPNGVSLDWGSLLTTLAEKHADEKKWFPDLMLRKGNLLFPLRVWDQNLEEHRELKAAWFNDEASAYAVLYMLSNNFVPFPIPTTTLQCMLYAGFHPKTSLSTNIAITYLTGMHNLGQDHKETAPILHGAGMLDLVRQIGNKEADPVATAFYQNTMSSGMLQHYFDNQRHEDAPRFLCLTIVQYGLRLLQILERQFLRLSQLGYVKGESSQLCMSSRLSDWEDEGTKRSVTAKCLEFMDLVLVPEDTWAKPESWPACMTPPPTREEVEKCTLFHYGVNAKYAEFILWRLHARIRFEKEEPVEVDADV